MLDSIENAILQILENKPEGCFPRKISEFLSKQGYDTIDIHNAILDLHDLGKIVVSSNRKLYLPSESV